MTSTAWEWVPLGSLFDVGAGKSMSASARGGENKVPFLRTSNVLWDRIDLTSLDEMAISPKELVEKRLEAGDLLVCEGGEIGRAAVWQGEVEVVSFQNHLHRLRPSRADVDSQFYVFFLQSAFTQLGIFEGAGNKTTIPNLSSGQLKALEVPHPPLDEQERIVAALRAVRNGQDAHRHLYDLAVELRRTAGDLLFQQGLNGPSRERASIGDIPAHWEMRAIRDLADITSGGTPKKSVAEYWEGDVPWVSGKDLKRPLLDDSIDHVSSAGVSAGSRLAPGGAVLLLVRGMGLAKDLPIGTTTRPMAFNQDVKSLVLKDEFAEYSGRFLRAAIYAAKERLLSQIARSAHGTMTLNLNDIENLTIGWPTDVAEATAIAELVDVLESKIDLHKKKLELTAELYATLLRGLMTGAIDIETLNLSALAPIKEAL